MRSSSAAAASTERFETARSGSSSPPSPHPSASSCAGAKYFCAHHSGVVGNACQLRLAPSGELFVDRFASKCTTLSEAFALPPAHDRDTAPELRDAKALERAGADVVAAGEAEIGVALVEAVTAADEAAADTAEERRAAVRARLYGTGA
jgi:hypothetical protein